MSGISGFLDLNQAGVANADLGKTATRHAESGCVIAADASLYYRDDLLAALGINRAPESDAELILAAYLHWGEACVDHLEGDFAFAIWDPRDRKLLCARDRYGMRPFYYHYSPGKCLAIASVARDIFRFPEVPFAINEGRIADFIVPELEWIDYTSTFYQNIFRLPPAHTLRVSTSGLHVAEYYEATPGSEPGLSADAEYREAFRDLFARAVDERLRASDASVGSMLSGGMDSGSVVAVASDILRGHGDSPLLPFSLARHRGADCLESRRIYATLDFLDLKGHQVIADDQDSLIEGLGCDLDEPFDGEMLFAKAIYDAARRRGTTVVLDGAAGDVVFNEGRHISRLIRRLHWRRAWREIEGEQSFWGESSVLPALLRHLRAGLVPDAVKKPFRPMKNRASARSFVASSLIKREFADYIDIESRFERMARTFSGTLAEDPGLELVRKIRPNLTAGRERYARIAASAGAEARDPFTDQRVVDFCTRLPGDQLLRNGWPKFILREAMEGKLPDEVRWGREKPHIGHVFNQTFLEREKRRGKLRLDDVSRSLNAYVDDAALRAAWRQFERGGNANPVHSAYVLHLWLKKTVTRPVVKDQQFR